ncbi:hypothetical protein COV87_02400 [Candidatus Roizmanbacteria bacterium CG11_big_fil_rev_8_21_14_0_20_37_16]|uniref:ABC transporter permease n=1 Tax=Candidatus Roizmanbacteria bacterium CG11_big_fil_rev_8_21_14_0_20_37_16 TaxID=1974857 RepID=A0A2H0KK37_9BACT|nr:MAG: hypothetical protein COV87_02400 [Candidatus Roizmanbacteria bacterium CG11_big_fil_rev_8_21_14_0_20_37_16]
MYIFSNLIREKLSDFFVNLSASCFFAASITPGFKTQNTVDLYLSIFNYLIFAIIYFISSITILKHRYE